MDPGTPAAEGTEEVEASGRILMPGLINSQTHSSGNVTRSWMDRWRLELQLSGGPAVPGSRTLDDKYVSALLGRGAFADSERQKPPHLAGRSDVR